MPVKKNEKNYSFKKIMLWDILVRDGNRQNSPRGQKSGFIDHLFSAVLEKNIFVCLHLQKDQQLRSNSPWDWICTIYFLIPLCILLVSKEDTSLLKWPLSGDSKISIFLCDLSSPYWDAAFMHQELTLWASGQFKSDAQLWIPVDW